MNGNEFVEITEEIPPRKKKRSGKKVQTQDQSKRTKLVIEPEKQVETIVSLSVRYLFPLT